MPLGGKITPQRRKDKRAMVEFLDVHRKKGPTVMSVNPSVLWWAVRDSNPEPTD